MATATNSHGHCKNYQIWRDQWHRENSLQNLPGRRYLACCNFLTWPSASCTASEHSMALWRGLEMAKWCHLLGSGKVWQRVISFVLVAVSLGRKETRCAAKRNRTFSRRSASFLACSAASADCFRRASSAVCAIERQPLACVFYQENFVALAILALVRGKWLKYTHCTSLFIWQLPDR